MFNSIDSTSDCISFHHSNGIVFLFNYLDYSGNVRILTDQTLSTNWIIQLISAQMKIDTHAFWIVTAELFHWMYSCYYCYLRPFMVGFCLSKTTCHIFQINVFVWIPIGKCVGKVSQRNPNNIFLCT